ncbi:unnamed protein product [Haemonchus placei]|uniref:Band 7 domain-containing protein n=1 Tax=Haemonchus placei TaxID=6290 RepID=A0A3P7X465_HAEPC|nr:unnamed protein product [Haemonchus placei]
MCRQVMKNKINSLGTYSRIHPPPSIADRAVVGLCWALLLLTFPISLFFCVKIVSEYKRMVIFRLGKIWKSRACGPGVVTMIYDVPTQELLTLDCVTVAVDAAVYYKARDPIAYLSEVHDAHYSTRQLAQATLRNTLGTRTLAQIMSDRNEIAEHMEYILDRATSIWGISVERFVIKDVRLPTDLCRAMATEAEAVKAAEAKLIFALGELSVRVFLYFCSNRINLNNPLKL